MQFRMKCKEAQHQGWIDSSEDEYLYFQLEQFPPKKIYKSIEVPECQNCGDKPDFHFTGYGCEAWFAGDT